MKRASIFRALALVLTLLTAAGVAAAASDAGSSKDPLITLSYLEKVYTPKVLDQADQLLTQRNAQLEKELAAAVAKLAEDPGYESPDAPAQGTAVVYTPVRLENGQTLTLSFGTEVMLRSGSASGQSSLVDATGGSFSGGALTKNHLYLSTQDGQTVTGSGELLVRGNYRVQ